MGLTETGTATEGRRCRWLGKRNENGLVERYDDAKQEAGCRRVEKAGGGWSAQGSGELSDLRRGGHDNRT